MKILIVAVLFFSTFSFAAEPQALTPEERIELLLAQRDTLIQQIEILKLQLSFKDRSETFTNSGQVLAEKVKALLEKANCKEFKADFTCVPIKKSESEEKN